MVIYLKRCFNKYNVTIHIKTQVVLLCLLSVLLVTALLSTRPAVVTAFGTFRSPSVDTRNIFFVESSCVTDQSGHAKNVTMGIHLSARQACAIESTARANPRALVYLLHTCPMDGRRLAGSPEFVKDVFSYPNVFGHHVDVYQFLKGTPMHDWYPSSELESSQFAVQHGSDILRLVALWKYGGVYLDLDFVVFKSLTDLGTNFAGFEAAEDIANGVLSFEAGHRLAQECLEEIKVHYEGSKFAENGPTLIKTMLMRYCHAVEIVELTPENCHGFKVYPYEYFYLIDYPEVSKFFDNSQVAADEVLRIDEVSYMAHLWNTMSQRQVVDKTMQQGYGLLASKYCPTVYEHSGRYF